MKVKRLLPWVTAMALVAGAYTPPASANVDIGFSIGINSFESNLSPHGNWFVSAQYGRVWQPSVYHAGWNPYYDGHWVYTDVGWTWVSDYRWGSIPYHYGTWALDPEGHDAGRYTHTDCELFHGGEISSSVGGLRRKS